MHNINVIKDTLSQHVNVARRDNPLFFKTGPGEYAEHDKFLGVAVPTVRKIAKEYAHISLEEIHSLLLSPYNEERLLALFIIVNRYKKADTATQAELYYFYKDNMKYVNNWNLVDQSADLIMGSYLADKDKSILFDFARSADLWERRIAIISTFYYIKKCDYTLTLSIATILLNDTHDLIHKAVGWMLREVGKRDEVVLREFLDGNASRMPRTMLRYAIEKFSVDERRHYLNK